MPLLLFISGLTLGIVVGFTTRRARFCTFGAIEDWVLGNDTRRLQAFALALSIAIAGTQGLIAFGFLDQSLIRYLPQELPWLAILAGGFLFGTGMALVGTCAFGSLVRFGSGDLRSFIVILIYGLAGYTILRGTLFSVRTSLFETVRVAMPHGSQSSFPELSKAVSGEWLRVAMPLMVGSGLMVWALAGGKLLEKRRLTWAAICLGLAVVAGWVVTSAFSDPFVAAATPESLTFVAPIAKAIVSAVIVSTAHAADFGAGTVLGVILGSFLATAMAREFRWEAFDDSREMKRHLLGALLMGFGGVLAGGCTIGQGLTAGSLLAVSWPLAIGGIIAGARLGIVFILTGL